MPAGISGGNILPADITGVESKIDTIDALVDTLIAARATERTAQSVQAATIADTVETTIITATAAKRHDPISLVFTNNTDTALVVTIRDDTAAAARFTVNVPIAATLPVYFGPAGLKQSSAVNKNWTAQRSAGTGNLLAFAVFTTV